MNIEKMLRDAVEDHTRQAAPPVDAGSLVRRGRRRRMVVTGSAVLATVAVVAGSIVGIGQLGDDAADRDGAGFVGDRAGPGPVPGLRAAFRYDDGRLAADGSVSEPGARADIGISSEQVVYRDTDGVLHAYTPGEGDRTLSDGPVRSFAADPTQPLVAFPDPDEPALVVVDTSTGAEVARRTWNLGGSQAEGSEYLLEVSAMTDGVVLLYTYEDNFAWDPAAEPSRQVLRIGGPDPGSVQQAHARTVLVTGARDAFTALPPGWTATPSQQGRDLRLSYDGSWVVDRTGTAWSVDDPAATVPVDAPGEPVEYAWDTDGSVLVMTETRPDGDFQVVDCVLGEDCTPVSGPESSKLWLSVPRVCSTGQSGLECFPPGENSLPATES